MAVDRLAAAAPRLQGLLLEGASFGAAAGGARAPHRHDYHELIWARSGSGNHLIDGERHAVEPGTVTLIGRGQVHVFESASGLSGAVVRFGGELLHEGFPAARATPEWLLGGPGTRTVAVPPGESARLDAVIDALGAESRRPLDSCGLDLERHLLAVLLLWVER